jgi:hypothetical protein
MTDRYFHSATNQDLRVELAQHLRFHAHLTGRAVDVVLQTGMPKPLRRSAGLKVPIPFLVHPPRRLLPMRLTHWHNYLHIRRMDFRPN